MRRLTRDGPVTTCNMVAGRPVLTVARLATALSELALRTDLVTEDAPPPRRAVALAGLRVAGCPVLAVAGVPAVLAVHALLARPAAQLPKPARAAEAGAVLRLAVRVIEALADPLAALAVGVDGAGPVAVGARVARAADALAGVGVAPGEARGVTRTSTYVSVWLGWHLQGREQCSPYSQLSPVPLQARCPQAAPAHPSRQEQEPSSGSHEPPF